MDMRWQPITGPAGHGNQDALYVCGYEVARVTERVGGGWFAILRYPGRKEVFRMCTTYETGRSGCETWAKRHYTTLEAAGQLRRLEWLAKQTWRGEDAVGARRQLQALRDNPPLVMPAATPSLTPPERRIA